jgi:hypothetical protein
MIARNDPFGETCAQLFNAFFKKFPNDELRKRTAIAVPPVVAQPNWPARFHGVRTVARL